MDGNICRNCHEGGGDLIAPCACSGSVKWVHRRCLDTWRAVSPNPASFTTCDICKTQYRLRHKAVSSFSYVGLVLKCVRDLVVVNAVIWSLVLLCGLLAWFFDANVGWTGVAFPASWLPTLTHPAFEIVCFGSLTLCFFVGLMTIFAFVFGGMCGCADNSAPVRYDTYGYNSFFPPWWWWWLMWNPPYHHTGCLCAPADCHGAGANSCDCKTGGGGGDAGKAIVIIILVIVVIIALIGFFVGVAFLIYMMSRLMSHHIKVLQAEIQAQGLEVIDLAREPDAQSEPGLAINPPVSAYQTGGFVPDVPKPYLAGFGPESNGYSKV